MAFDPDSTNNVTVRRFYGVMSSLWAKIKAKIPAPSTTTPIVDGTATKGTDAGYARGDHVHPTDTSREAASNKKTTLNASSNTEFPTSKAVATFVNSSIATATANFLGTYDVVADLGLTTSATNAQIATALGSHTWPSGVSPTNNDYVFVSVDDPGTTTTSAEYRRFKYDGSAWEYEYTLNNSSFTQAQWDAINSGVTASFVTNAVTGVKGSSESTYRTGQVSISKSNIGLGNVANTGDSATPVSGGTTKFTTGGAYTELAKKAPNDHASTDTTYGVGTSTKYGHVKLYDSVAAENTDGAPTQNAVHDALDDKSDKNKVVAIADAYARNGNPWCKVAEYTWTSTNTTFNTSWMVTFSTNSGVLSCETFFLNLSIHSNASGAAPALWSFCTSIINTLSNTDSRRFKLVVTGSSGNLLLKLYYYGASASNSMLLKELRAGNYNVASNSKYLWTYTSYNNADTRAEATEPTGDYNYECTFVYANSLAVESADALNVDTLGQAGGVTDFDLLVPAVNKVKYYTINGNYTNGSKGTASTGYWGELQVFWRNSVPYQVYLEWNANGIIYFCRYASTYDSTAAKWIWTAWAPFRAGFDKDGNNISSTYLKIKDGVSFSNAVRSRQTESGSGWGKVAEWTGALTNTQVTASWNAFTTYKTGTIGRAINAQISLNVGGSATATDVPVVGTFKVVATEKSATTYDFCLVVTGTNASCTIQLYILSQYNTSTSLSMIDRGGLGLLKDKAGWTYSDSSGGAGGKPAADASTNKYVYSPQYVYTGTTQEGLGTCAYYSLYTANTSSSAPGWVKLATVTKSSATYQGFRLSGYFYSNNGNLYATKGASGIHFQAVFTATNNTATLLYGPSDLDVANCVRIVKTSSSPLTWELQFNFGTNNNAYAVYASYEGDLTKLDNEIKIERDTVAGTTGDGVLATITPEPDTTWHTSYALWQNLLEVGDANSAIPASPRKNKGGSVGEYYVSASASNVPSGQYSYHIRTSVYRYSSTVFRGTQLATASYSTPVSVVYERSGTSSDGTTWTWGTWNRVTMSSDLATATVGTAKNILLEEIGTSAVDLNSLTASDMTVHYYTWSNTNRGNVSNKPSDAVYTIKVFPCGAGSAGTYVMQEAYKRGTNERYVRRRSDGSTAWSSWQLCAYGDGSYPNMSVGTCTGNATSATTAKAYDTSFSGTNSIATALAAKQSSLPTSGTASSTYAINISGNAATATTTADTSNTLYVVGVQSGATSTLKHDTSVTVKGNTVTAANFAGNASTATKPKTNQIASTADLNDYKGSSTGDVLWYYWTSTAPTHAPLSGSSAVMQVVKEHSGNYVRQTVYVTGGQIFTRKCKNDTWDANWADLGEVSYENYALGRIQGTTSSGKYYKLADISGKKSTSTSITSVFLIDILKNGDVTQDMGYLKVRSSCTNESTPTYSFSAEFTRFTKAVSIGDIKVYGNTSTGVASIYAYVSSSTSDDWGHIGARCVLVSDLYQRRSIGQYVTFSAEAVIDASAPSGTAVTVNTTQIADADRVVAIADAYTRANNVSNRWCKVAEYTWTGTSSTFASSWMVTFIASSGAMSSESFFLNFAIRANASGAPTLMTFTTSIINTPSATNSRRFKMVISGSSGNMTMKLYYFNGTSNYSSMTIREITATQQSSAGKIKNTWAYTSYNSGEGETTEPTGDYNYECTFVYASSLAVASAQAYDTSFSGTNSIATALAAKQPGRVIIAPTYSGGVWSNDFATVLEAIEDGKDVFLYTGNSEGNVDTYHMVPLTEVVKSSNNYMAFQFSRPRVWSSNSENGILDTWTCTATSPYWQFEGKNVYYAATAGEAFSAANASNYSSGGTIESTFSAINTALAGRALGKTIPLPSGYALSVTISWATRTGRSSMLAIVSGNNGVQSCVQVSWFKDANNAITNAKMNVLSYTNTGAGCVPMFYVQYGTQAYGACGIYLVLDNSSWATQVTVIPNMENVDSVAFGYVAKSTAQTATDLSSARVWNLQGAWDGTPTSGSTNAVTSNGIYDMTQGYKIRVVNALPGTPDANTLYFV